MDITFKKATKEDMTQSTYNVRIRVEYVAYYDIKADSWFDAERIARERLDEEMNDKVYPSEDITEYDPRDFEWLTNPPPHRRVLYAPFVV